MSVPKTANKPTTTTDDKSSRKQLSKVLNIDMSSSRSINCLNKRNLNEKIEKSLEQLRARKKDAKFKLSDETMLTIEKAYKNVFEPKVARHSSAVSRAKGDVVKIKALGPTPKRCNSVDEQIELVSKMRWRFSDDSKVALASILDYVLEKIVEASMIKTKADGKSIIHLKQALVDTENLTVYPLLCGLPVIREILATSNTEEKTESDHKEEQEQESDTEVPNFMFYVQQKCKRVKSKLSESNSIYESIRVSFDFRKHCSEAIVQLVNRLSLLIELYSTTANIKTVDNTILKYACKSIFIYAGVCYKDLEKYVDDRLSLFKEYKSRK